MTYKTKAQEYANARDPIAAFEKKASKYPVGQIRNLMDRGYNWREAEILAWVNSMIDRYHTDKGNPEYRKAYLEAKDIRRKVWDGHFRNPDGTEKDLEARASPASRILSLIA